MKLEACMLSVINFLALGIINCVISDFRCGVTEIFDLLGCYAAWIGSLLPQFRDKLSVPSFKGILGMLDP